MLSRFCQIVHGTGILDVSEKNVILLFSGKTQSDCVANSQCEREVRSVLEMLSRFWQIVRGTGILDVSEKNVILFIFQGNAQSDGVCRRNKTEKKKNKTDKTQILNWKILHWAFFGVRLKNREKYFRELYSLCRPPAHNSQCERVVRSVLEMLSRFLQIVRGTGILDVSRKERYPLIFRENVKADYTTNTKSCIWFCSAKFSVRARSEKCPEMLSRFSQIVRGTGIPQRQRKERYPLIFRENAVGLRVSSKQTREK
ncbi:hypothetical protein CEXT_542821 [Caerostris extrusa]|uniref:Uncharacterized protein n=1 Tax=Caerostris extrusa TaxID=172846 RepID=A0AAV4Q976_CAEEX|nr:hypothetical protein CEXT_542821 [Caerostris extrusa]